MSSATVSFNNTIISKLSWMSGQLRKIDDLNALVNWVNTMHSIKALLFPQSSDLCCSGTANHKISHTLNSSPLQTPLKSMTANLVPNAINRAPTQRPQLINWRTTLQRSPLYNSAVPLHRTSNQKAHLYRFHQRFSTPHY